MDQPNDKLPTNQSTTNIPHTDSPPKTGQFKESDFLQFRMPTWEEDISLNHNSVAPFKNHPAPSEMPLQAFAHYRNISQLTDELLDGTPVEDFVGRDHYPIPADTDREGYNANHNAVYFLNGLADHLKLMKFVHQHGCTVENYFDFGCASGRVLRHFCTQGAIANLWGSDINGRHIKWLNDFLPAQLKPIHNHCLPHLPIADNSLDLISAFSVFTHIDIFETAWLAELHRILRPGGMVYLTVQNDASWQLLRESPDDHPLNAMVLKRQPNFRKILEADLPDHRVDFRRTDLGPYRALVFHSNRYLQRTWGRYFDIIDILPLSHGIHQSVFLGTKR